MKLAKRLAAFIIPIILLNLISYHLLGYLTDYRMHISLECRGNDYIFSINGREITSVDYAELSAGRVGIRLIRPRGDVYIDNLKLMDPTSHDVIIHDRFNTLDDSLWEVRSGAWKAKDGRLYVQRGGELLTRRRDFNDYAMELDILGWAQIQLIAKTDGYKGLLAQVNPDKDVCWYRFQGRELGLPRNCKNYDARLNTIIRDLARIVLETYRNSIRLVIFIVLPLAGASLLLGLIGLFLPRGLITALVPASLRDLVQGVNGFLKRAYSSRIFGSIYMIALFLAAFVILGLVADKIYDRVPHVQDSISTLHQARIFAKGKLWAPAPPLHGSFDFEMIVNRDGKWYSKYQWVQPFLLMFGVWLGIPWLVTPFVSAVGLMFIFLIAQELYGRTLGIFASLLTLSSPFYIFMGASFMQHPACMTFLCIFIYLIIIARRRRRILYAVLAGIALGFAANARALSSLGASFPFMALFFYDLIKHDLRRNLKIYLAFLLAILPLLACTFLYNYLLTGDFILFPLQAYSAADHLGFGEGVGWLGGHSPIKGLDNILKNLQNLIEFLFGWNEYMTLAFLLIPFITLSRNRWDYIFLGIWFFLAAGYFFWWYHGICYGPRFWYEAMPAYTILTIRGAWRIGEIYSSICKPIRGGSRRFKPPILPWLAIAIALILIAGNVRHNLKSYLFVKMRSVYKNYNGITTHTLEQVKRMGIENAIIFIAFSHIWQDWGSVFVGNDPWLTNDVLYAYDRGAEQNKKVMELFPGRNYYMWKRGQVTPYRPQEPKQQEPSFDEVPFIPGAKVNIYRGGKGRRLGNFSEPRDIDTAPDGTILVADFRNYRIQKAKPDGTPITAWGTRGNKDKNFNDPCGIAISDDYFIYVADTFNGKVKKFDFNGTLIASWEGFYAPRGITVGNDGFIYVADTENNRIRKFDADGKQIIDFGQEQLKRPIGIAQGIDGNIYVCSTKTKQVIVFDSQGKLVRQWDLEGGDELDYGESYLDVDAQGNVWVSAPKDHKVQKFTSNGELIFEFGRRGVAHGQFNVPTGIALHNGYLYVTDTWNHRIQRFELSSLK